MKISVCLIILLINIIAAEKTDTEVAMEKEEKAKQAILTTIVMLDFLHKNHCLLYNCNRSNWQEDVKNWFNCIIYPSTCQKERRMSELEHICCKIKFCL